ncbi:invasion associated locus B family protein [Allosphingosinicella indica]|uniref:Invasion associated locus B family protein n=1 Tax=Allosphingosinicella indica TaxID=941907 RepID=A0A1X7GBM8_9SPHN|nr:invasion associated locus B family protein [Allosphingosinicella indica]SMF66577.1 hypothetical protein SAMN06295910_1415 [Allosphingosinicella indica]
MRRAIFLLAIAVCTVPAAAPAERRAIGIFSTWGTFADANPRRCFAIVEPLRRARAGERSASASISYWPRRGIVGQFHARLSREKRPGSAVLLRIGDQTFQLLAGPGDAWAADPRTDAAIVSAMRSELEMTVETRATNGAPVRDRYPLQGAASAIDAAAVECAR